MQYTGHGIPLCVFLARLFLLEKTSPSLWFLRFLDELLTNIQRKSCNIWSCTQSNMPIMATSWFFPGICSSLCKRKGFLFRLTDDKARNQKQSHEWWHFSSDKPWKLRQMQSTYKVTATTLLGQKLLWVDLTRLKQALTTILGLRNSTIRSDANEMNRTFSHCWTTAES